MSFWNVYLVPLGEPVPTKKWHSGTVLEYLESRGIVGGLLPPAPGTYAVGTHARDLFSPLAAGDPAFQSVVLYDKPGARFVPHAHVGGFGASCSSCGTGLDGALAELLAGQAGTEEPKDLAGGSVPCPSCGHANALISLCSDIDTAVTRFYIEFCRADSLELSRSLIVELERVVGDALRIVPERL